MKKLKKILFVYHNLNYDNQITFNYMTNHDKKLIQSYIPGFVSTHKYIQELDRSYWIGLEKQEKLRLIELAEKRKNIVNNLYMYDDSILELDLSYQQIEGILVL